MKISARTLYSNLPLIIFIGFFILLLIYVNQMIFSLSYDQFITRIAHMIHRENWTGFLEKKFTVRRFLLAKWLFVCIDFIFFFLIILIIRFSSGIKTYLSLIFTQASSIVFREVIFLRHLSKQHKVFLSLFLGIIVIKSLWYNIYIPLQYDEMWSYNYYVQNSFWQTFLLPGNNHKIYTVIAWWFNLIPWYKQFFIRLPNTLTGIIAIISFYYFARKYFSTFITLVGVVWFATSCPVGIYMTTARSYIYVLLFSIWLLKACLVIIENRASSLTWFLLFFIITIGYWGNPVMFFGHVFLSVLTVFFLFNDKNFEALKNFIRINVLSFLFILILYLPDFVGGHFDSLISAAYHPVTPDNYFFLNIYHNAFFQIGTMGSHWTYLGIILLVLFLLIFKWKSVKQKRLQIISMAAILYLPCWDMLTHFTNAYHIAIYLTLYFTLLIMFLLSYFDVSIIAGSRISTGILVIVIMVYNSYAMNRHGWFLWSKEQDEENIVISDMMMSNDIHNCYLGYDYLKPALRFYYKQENKKIEIRMPFKTSNDFEEFDGHCKYQAIIVSDEYPLNIDQSCYKLVHQSANCKCYFLTNPKGESGSVSGK